MAATERARIQLETPVPTGDKAEVLRAARLGVHFCRQGDWKSGLRILERVIEQDRKDVRLPGSFYSWLGLATARRRPKAPEAQKLCEHAIKVEPYRVESYANLAHVYWLAGRYARSAQVVERGLELAPGNRRLLRLLHRVGVRRGPVLPFLSRSNPLNRLLGVLRHRFLGPQRPKRPRT